MNMFCYKESDEMEALSSTSSQLNRGIIISILNQRGRECYKAKSPAPSAVETVLLKHPTNFSGGEANLHCQALVPSEAFSKLLRNMLFSGVKKRFFTSWF